MCERVQFCVWECVHNVCMHVCVLLKWRLSGVFGWSEGQDLCESVTCANTKEKNDT